MVIFCHVVVHDYATVVTVIAGQRWVISAVRSYFYGRSQHANSVGIKYGCVTNYNEVAIDAYIAVKQRVA